MKKHGLMLLLFPLSFTVLLSCGKGNQPASPSSSDAPFVSSTGNSSEGTSSASTSTPEAGVFKGILRLYFHNDDNTETAKNVYAWIPGLDGKEFAWDGKADGYGVYKDFDLGADPYLGVFSDSFFFIIKNPGTWAGQSTDTEVKMADFSSYITTDEKTGKSLINVYSAQGDGGVISVFEKKADALGDRFNQFSLGADWKSMTIGGTGEIANYILYGFDRTYYSYSAVGKANHMDEYILSQGSPKSLTISLDLTALAYPDGKKVASFDPHVTYYVEGFFSSAPGKRKHKTASAYALYDTAKFVSDYTYSGNDLGLTYSASKSEFRLWAPTASRVELYVYTTGTPHGLSLDPASTSFDDYFSYYELQPQNGGVFSGSVAGNLAGKFYAYHVYVNDTSYILCDPYAKATGINGERAAIIDFASTNPTGFTSLSFPALSSPNALSVYEAHIRDFTADSSWVSTKGNARGGYNAFVEEGTTYSENGLTVTTGFDHLKELGVNAVQLMPVFDQDNDERKAKVTNYETKTSTVDNLAPGYNWGYNPKNYSVVEGAYSSDPYDPAVRIKEFKNLVQKLASAGMRTIMDVVYNHVSSVSSTVYNKAVPQYFFRLNADGSYSAGTGCGNDFASERVMARKAIVDSVRFWAEEYQIKGFRFDLMGSLDVTTMKAVKAACYDVDPSIVVYGEPWTAGDTTLAASERATASNVYSKLYDCGHGDVVGCFNDDCYGSFVGNTDGTKPGFGFISQGAGYLSQTTLNRTSLSFIGTNDGDGANPYQTVNYVACHDNYTLYDHMNYCLGSGTSSVQDNEAAMKATAGAQGAMFLSEGICFLHAGDEIMRQKIMLSDNPYWDTIQPTDYVEIDASTRLIRNSYAYGDKVNAIQWSRKANALVHANYLKIAEAAALRKTMIGDTLGMSYSDVSAGKATMWGSLSTNTLVTAAYMRGRQSQADYYVLLGGNMSADWSGISIANGTLQVVYSSNGMHTKDDSITITNGSIGAGKYELLLVKRNA